MAATSVIKSSCPTVKVAGSLGYSLFELLLTLSIIVFLLLIALPDLSTLIDTHKLHNRVQLLLLSIKEAKIAALNKDQNIIICAKKSLQSQCLGSSIKGSIDWRDGWLVFVDSNRDMLYQNEEKLLSLVNISASSCHIVWNRGEVMSFGQFGVLQGGKAGSFMFNCADQSTQLVVNWVGRVRLISRK